MNKAILGKPMENVRQHRNTKLVDTESRRNFLVSEPNYHTTKFFTKNLLAMEMRKPQILMNKHGYLGLSILDLSKTNNFGIIMENQNMMKMQNFLTWIQTPSLFI